MKKPIIEENYIWGECGLPAKKIHSADTTGENRLSCHVAGTVLKGTLMGAGKNLDHTGHGVKWAAEKANGKAQYGKRITSGSNNAIFITAQIIKISEEIMREEVRPERIEFIRSLLDIDAYKIEPDEIAREMLGEIWQGFKDESSSFW